MSLSYKISICTAAGEAGNLQAMISEICAVFKIFHFVSINVYLLHNERIILMLSFSTI